MVSRETCFSFENFRAKTPGSCNSSLTVFDEIDWSGIRFPVLTYRAALGLTGTWVFLLLSALALVETLEYFEVYFVEVVRDWRAYQITERVQHQLHSNYDIPLTCKVIVLPIKDVTKERKPTFQIGSNKEYDKACIEEDDAVHCILHIL